MIQRIKDFLNSSFVWLLFLVGCIAYLFQKEKHLEDQLKEQKFDDAIKETKDEQAKIDSDAGALYAKYNRELREYNDRLRSSSEDLRGSGSGAAETDSDSGSKD